MDPIIFSLLNPEGIKTLIRFAPRIRYDHDSGILKVNLPDVTTIQLA